MDKADKVILKALAQQADITTTDLVPHAHLSVPAINKRIAKMKDSGVIKNFTILTDPVKLGKHIRAYIFVLLDSPESTDSFVRYTKSNPDILECCTITGKYDFLLKVYVSDIDALENILQLIKKKHGVVQSQTSIILTEHKFSPTVLPDDIT